MVVVMGETSLAVDTGLHLRMQRTVVQRQKETFRRHHHLHQQHQVGQLVRPGQHMILSARK